MFLHCLVQPPFNHERRATGPCFYRAVERKRDMAVKAFLSGQKSHSPFLSLTSFGALGLGQVSWVLISSPGNCIDVHRVLCDLHLGASSIRILSRTVGWGLGMFVKCLPQNRCLEALIAQDLVGKPFSELTACSLALSTSCLVFSGASCE